jgi:hypothetical protein
MKDRIKNKFQIIIIIIIIYLISIVKFEALKRIFFEKIREASKHVALIETIYKMLSYFSLKDRGVNGARKVRI